MKAYRIIVHGRVQGVGFRAFVIHHAEMLNIKGTVKNDRDGSVVVHAEGNDNELEIFITKCSQGPTWSHVSNIDKAEAAIQGYNSFNIIR